MRKIFTMTMILISGPFLFSQPYFPIPTKNTSWKVIYWSYDWPNQYVNRAANYRTGKDTVINGDTFTSLVYQLDENVYFGAFREDSNRKVYLVPKDSTQEYLLFDFAVDLGDTLLNIYPALNDTLITVRIDTFDNPDPTYPGLGRRRIHLKNLTYGSGYSIFTDSWIEGVGSNSGLIDVNYKIKFESSIDLACFKIEDTTRLGFNYCPPVGIEESETSQTVVEFANPSKGDLEVKMKNVPHGRFEISLSDNLGRIVHHAVDNEVSTFNINTSNLKSGLYVLSLLFADGSRISQKVILE